MENTISKPTKLSYEQIVKIIDGGNDDNKEIATQPSDLKQKKIRKNDVEEIKKRENALRLFQKAI